MIYIFLPSFSYFIISLVGCCLQAAYTEFKKMALRRYEKPQLITDFEFWTARHWRKPWILPPPPKKHRCVFQKKIDLFQKLVLIWRTFGTGAYF